MFELDAESRVQAVLEVREMPVTHALRGALLICACALLCLGCQKRSAEQARMESLKGKVAAEQKGEVAPGTTPEQSDKLRDMRKEELAKLPPDTVDVLRAQVISQSTTYDYDYDSTLEVIKGLGLPPSGLSTDEIVLQVYTRAGDKKSLTDQTAASKEVEAYYKNLVDQLRQLAQSQVEQPKEAIDWQALRAAEDPVGEWRSTREVREGESVFMVEHDDRYYKLLMLDNKGHAVMQEYNADREEKDRLVVTEFPYRYDGNTGELSLIGPEGNPYQVFVTRSMPANREVMYVKTKEDFVYTQYERIGAGGKKTDKNTAEAQQQQSDVKPRSARGGNPDDKDKKKEKSEPKGEGK
jgi:hypothetical protein